MLFTKAEQGIVLLAGTGSSLNPVGKVGMAWGMSYYTEFKDEITISNLKK